jgi:plasmid rolling circle replication initiator protein Rep
MYKQSITDASNFDNEILKLEVIEGTGEILHDTSASGRERPWGRHKMGNEKIFKLYEKAKEKELVFVSDGRMQDLKECADSVLFNIDSTCKRKLAKANFCRFRTCPMCCWRKSMKLYSQVSAITDTIMERQDGTRFIFVTLTVRNVKGEDLRAELDRINKAWKYITSKAQTFAPAKKLKGTLLGYLKAVEVTYNASQDTYHPHLHCIVEVSPEYFESKNYISRAKWSELWAQALKSDYMPSVDVKAIDSTSRAVAEVSKYPVKMDSVLKIRNKAKAVEVLAVIHNAVRGRRLLTFGGDMAKVKRQLALDDIEDGDLLHVETDNEKELNPIAQILFRFNVGRGVYIC